MLAAEKGRMEVCLKLAELGADLNKKANGVSETCCSCISVGFCNIVMLTFFFLFEQVWMDGRDVGC